MINEILEILIAHKAEAMSQEQAVSELMYLFAIEYASRVLAVGDHVKWRGMDLIVVEVGVNEVLIATSINADDQNYNDWWVPLNYLC